MTDHPIRFRAIQLDLASQKETPEFIRRFIDFIARYDFNVLLLYLEWRVRTRAFDPGPAAGYSAEELRAIIDHAASCGITVIPGLAALGHAQMATRSPGFADLDELRNNLPGRFGIPLKLADLCPLQPRTQTLLEAYFTEVAAIFPGPFFHVGGDEAWNIGYCPQCREKARTFAGEQQLYLDHFKFCHQVVTGKLGKRMMLWDDMFEYYPDIPAEFPRDVIMVDWQYQDHVTGYHGHFANQNFSDRALLYDRLGFEYWGACAHYCLSNPESTWRYAQNRNHSGLLLTYWGAGLPFHTFPFFAATGLLWSDRAADGDDAVNQSAAALFGITAPPFANALREYLDTIRWICAMDYKELVVAPKNGLDHAELSRVMLLRSIFEHYRPEVSCEGVLYLEEILADLELKEWRWRCRIAAWNYRHDFPGEDLPALAQSIRMFARQRREAVQRFRPSATSVSERLEHWADALCRFAADFHNAVTLRLTLVQPDQLSLALLSADVFADNEWHQAVAPAPCKELSSAIYEADFALLANCRPERLRLTVRGFGGQGIAYAEVLSAHGRLIPGRVAVRSGRVEHPEYLEFADVTAAFFGHARTLDAFHDRKVADELNTVEIELVPDSLNR